MDLLAHRIELLFHLAVGKAQYLQAILAQDLAPLFVVSLPLFSIMLRAVQFNNQSCFRAVKIYHKRFNDPLFVDFYWVGAQKAKPKVLL